VIENISKEAVIFRIGECATVKFLSIKVKKHRGDDSLLVSMKRRWYLSEYANGNEKPSRGAFG